MAGFFSRLFGGKPKEDAKTDKPDEIYKDIEIYAHPKKEEGQWRIAGTMMRMKDGARVERPFLRADILATREEAVKATLGKARLIIDQNGESLWSGDLSRPA